jgi:hypothetical protein
MKLPGKGVWLAILLVFSPGIAFAVFELFFSELPVKLGTKLAGWVALGVGVTCVVLLSIISVREALQRRRQHRNPR